MRRLQRTGFAAGAGTLVAALLMAGAPAASASTSADTCLPAYPSNPAICFYDGADFTGLLDNNPPWISELPPEMNDKISSIVNNSDMRLFVWADKGFKGDWFEIPPHQTWVASPEWDNRISGAVATN